MFSGCHASPEINCRKRTGTETQERSSRDIQVVSGAAVFLERPVFPMGDGASCQQRLEGASGIGIRIYRYVIGRDVGAGQIASAH